MKPLLVAAGKALVFWVTVAFFVGLVHSWPWVTVWVLAAGIFAATVFVFYAVGRAEP